MHIVLCYILFNCWFTFSTSSWADTLCISEEYQPKGNLRGAIDILSCTKNQNAAVLMLFITL